jgi:hypothetical protein
MTIACYQLSWNVNLISMRWLEKQSSREHIFAIEGKAENSIKLINTRTVINQVLSQFLSRDSRMWNEVDSAKLKLMQKL